jgi:hypothetical protein
MPRLTDTQRVLLSAASRRDDGTLLPLPKRVTIETRALTRVLKTLLKKELVIEQPAATEGIPWRESPDGQRFMLVISPAGIDAIGVKQNGEGPKPDKGARQISKASLRRSMRSPRNQRKSAATIGVRPGTKLALLVEMLRHQNGASITEIGAATGWQSHSVRGAISGAVKKKLGLTVSSKLDNTRGRVYRITEAR